MRPVKAVYCKAARMRSDTIASPSQQQLLARLPLWWLFVVPLYWFPQRINWGLIAGYLLPFQTATLVGDQHKHFAYSMMIVSSNVGSIMGPVWGALSDKLVAPDGRRRRRVMVILGQTLLALVVYVMMESKTFMVLLIGYGATCAIST